MLSFTRGRGFSVPRLLAGQRGHHAEHRPISARIRFEVEASTSGTPNPTEWPLHTPSSSQARCHHVCFAHSGWAQAGLPSPRNHPLLPSFLPASDSPAIIRPLIAEVSAGSSLLITVWHRATPESGQRGDLKLGKVPPTLLLLRPPPLHSTFYLVPSPFSLFAPEH
jgi:hypothetical protein